MRFLIAALLVLASAVTRADDRTTRPNFVIILADDLGWADVGCYGNRFNETPHLDRLASEGLRFTQFYAGPVCSPTRANLQSGQDQARFGITQHIPGHRRPYARLSDPVVPNELPLEVETFAERLGSAGYATGYFGKWHLGRVGFGPQEQGWQTALECNGSIAPPALTGDAHERRMADFLSQKAEEFIAAHKSEPFLLQVSHAAVHIPLSTRPDLLNRFETRPKIAGYPCNPTYAGLLAELDESVGRIVKAIDDAGLGDRTLILFLSDNGGLEHEQSGRIVTSNDPLRGEKGTLYEGGIRVPAIARWPGRVAAAARCDVPVTTIDLYPTLLELASVESPSRQPMDGTSFASLLKTPDKPLTRDTLYWHLPHYHHSTPASAIRRGNWKLIEFFETGERQLFDLGSDPGETTDLVRTKPELAVELHASLAAWRTAVGARLPKPNPDYDPERADQLGNKRNVRRKAR